VILSFLAYLAARAALFFLAKEWRMLRVVAAVSITCDLARLGMMVLPSAPIVVVTDTALCILPSRRRVPFDDSEFSTRISARTWRRMDRR